MTLEEVRQAAIASGDYNHATCMIRVGHASPGSPCGDIWVSEETIAQMGIERVREEVRRTYRMAYKRVLF